MENRIIAKNLELYYSSMLKNIYIYILFPSDFFTPTSILFSLFLLFSISPSLLSPLYRPKRHLFSLFLLCGSGVWVVIGLWVRCLGRGCRRGSVVVVVFGCDRCLKGVVGRGWVRCLGRWSWLGLVLRSWLGCGSGVWVVGDSVGQWWLWFLAWVTVDLLVGGWIDWVDHW